MTVNGGDVIYAADVNTTIAQSVYTADSSTWTSTETSIMTVTANLVSGQTYMIEMDCNIGTSAVTYTWSSTNAEASSVRIREDTVSGNQLAQGQVFMSAASSVGFALTVRVPYTATATGEKTFVAGAQKSNSSAATHIMRAATSRPGLFTITKQQEVS
jgi:hypothetical protein